MKVFAEPALSERGAERSCRSQIARGEVRRLRNSLVEVRIHLAGRKNSEAALH